MGHIWIREIQTNAFIVNFCSFRHFKNATGAIIVFDITNRESFQSVKNWIYEVRNNSDNKVIIYLLGNKLDLEILRKVIYYFYKVEKTEGEIMAKQH